MQDAVGRLNVQLVGHVEDVQHDGHVDARWLDPYVDEAERRRVAIDRSTGAKQRRTNPGQPQPFHRKGMVTDAGPSSQGYNRPRISPAAPGRAMR